MGLLALVAGQDVEPAEGSDGTDGRWRIARPAIAIYPLPHMPVIKDLIVDMEPFFQSFREVMPFLINRGHEPTKERLQSAEDRGLLREVVAAANESWSLGPLTLPHMLVRLVVAEQLYRAASLLANHPYHRA